MQPWFRLLRTTWPAADQVTQRIILRTPGDVVSPLWRRAAKKLNGNPWFVQSAQCQHLFCRLVVGSRPPFTSCFNQQKWENSQPPLLQPSLFTFNTWYLRQDVGTFYSCVTKWYTWAFSSPEPNVLVPEPDQIDLYLSTLIGNKVQEVFCFPVDIKNTSW